MNVRKKREQHFVFQMNNTKLKKKTFCIVRAYYFPSLAKEGCFLVVVAVVFLSFCQKQ
jgi:hypothetical protein